MKNLATNIRTLLAVLVVISGLVGCAATPPQESQHNHSAASFSGFKAGQRVLVVPVLSAKNGELVKTQLLSKILTEQLQTKGLFSELLSTADYQGLWQTSLNQCNNLSTSPAPQIQSRRYQLALAIFLNELAQEKDFDLIVIPAFASRKLPVGNGLVSWDGVNRMSNIKRGDDDIVITNFRGHNLGLSVQLMVYDAKGQWLSNSYGGVSLMFDIDLEQSPPAFTRKRGKLYKREELVTGASVALNALLQDQDINAAQMQMQIANSH